MKEVGAAGGAGAGQPVDLVTRHFPKTIMMGVAGAVLLGVASLAVWLTTGRPNYSQLYGRLGLGLGAGSALFLGGSAGLLTYRHWSAQPQAAVDPVSEPPATPIESSQEPPYEEDWTEFDWAEFKKWNPQVVAACARCCDNHVLGLSLHLQLQKALLRQENLKPLHLLLNDVMQLPGNLSNQPADSAEVQTHFDAVKLVCRFILKTTGKDSLENIGIALMSSGAHFDATKVHFLPTLPMLIHGLLKGAEDQPHHHQILISLFTHLNPLQDGSIPALLDQSALACLTAKPDRVIQAAYWGFQRAADRRLFNAWGEDAWSAWFTPAKMAQLKANLNQVASVHRWKL